MVLAVAEVIAVIAMIVLLVTNGENAARVLVAKIMMTLFILMVMLLMSASELKMMQKRKIAVSTFAVIGLIANFVWLILCGIGIWNIGMVYGCANAPYESSCEIIHIDATPFESCITIDLMSSSECGFSTLGQIGIIAILVGVVSWAATNLLGLWVRDKKKVMLALSVVEILLLVVGAVALGIALLTPSLTATGAMGTSLIAGLVIGVIGVVLALVTWVIEKIDIWSEKKR